MGTKSKRVVFYHNDLDGVASAAIVYNLTPRSKFHVYKEVQYNQDISKEIELIDVFTEVYILDFSFDYTTMAHIASRCKRLYWIDHHKSSEILIYPLDEIGNTRIVHDTKRSGAYLTYKYITKKEPPIAIKAVDDYDRWQFQVEGSREFEVMFLTELKDYSNRVWKDLLINKPNKMYNELVKTGKLIVNHKKSLVESMVKKGFKIKILNQTMFAVNSSILTSDIGEYVYNNISDVAVIYQIKNENKVTLSFRSDKIDVLEIAKYFGGGGHPKAAGCEITLEDFVKYIQKE